MLRNGWSINPNGTINVPRPESVSGIMFELALATLDFTDALAVMELELEKVGR